MERRMLLKRIVIFIIAGVITYFSCSIYMGYQPPSISAATYRWGSRGSVVTEIQRRLKNWGYYNGSVDGIYGYQTYLAVRKFQAKNGLAVDGIVGSRTLSALGINAGTNSAYSASNSHTLISRAINGEARGEPYIGQVAVGGVILNRTRDPRFPNSVAGVIYQPGAFTAITDGQIHAEMVATSQRAARDALNGWDPSGGAIYYFNPAKTTNKWIWSRPLIKVIGSHRFCR
ncbi:spore cortex-lytic enzyme [Oxobacter pfennigii]|nr:spore cortex-lytic enzyme [Oxobacter pfennigii]